MCASCLQAFRLIAPPFCSKCGRPTQPAAGVTVCLGDRCRPLHFVRARSAAVYEGPVREAVHALKFARQRRLAEPLGELMAEVAVRDALLSESHVVVPVPLHRTRMRERGFNQAELLARPVARRLGVPVKPMLLHRVGDTPPQSTLSASARRTNIAGSFIVGESVGPVAVLLVDDVLSTGSTVSECARVLTAAGVSQVTVLTAAAAVARVSNRHSQSAKGRGKGEEAAQRRATSNFRPLQ